MKKRIVIILLLLTLLTTAIPAYAATGKVTTKTTTNLFDAYNASTKTWNELKTAQHRLSSKYVAYCLQHKKTVPNSETYNLNDLYDNYSDKVKKGLQIILTNGYPWENGGLSNAQAEYATANAVRFWLSECGDSEFYNQTNLGSFTDAQLRTQAAAGTIKNKIRVRDTSYIPALQFAVELLIKARAQETIVHEVSLSAASVSAPRSGSVFSGSTTVTVANLRGGYTIDSSSLPAGSMITGYTGTQTETISISIPASTANANRTYTLTISGMDDRCRANIAAIAHNSNVSYQRVMSIHVGTEWYTEVVSRYFTVTTGPYETAKPDLTITSLTPGKSTYVTGENMTFSAMVKNQGNAPAGRFDVALTMGDLTHYAYIDGLAIGASQAVSFEFTAPSSPQTVALYGKADSQEIIDESNEGNNTANTSVTVVAPSYPDLVITELRTDRGSYTAGDSMTITAVVKNQGTVSCGAFYTSMTGSNGASAKAYCGGLAAGASTTFTWQWTAGSAGQLTLTGYADCDGNVQESNEGNNTASTVVNVAAPTYPDLIITELRTDRGSYTTGDSMTITAVVKNRGAANCGAFNTSMTGSNGASAKAYCGGLPAGASTTLTWQWTAGSAGQLTLTGYADCDGNVQESNENNNTASTAVIIVAPSYPDLVIIALTTDASSYTVGDGMTISATVKNQGNAASGAFYTSLTGSNGASAKAYCGGLNIGAFTTLTWQWTAPASPCTLTFTGYADCDGNVQESNEGNNTASASVTIIARKYPDLTVTSVIPEQDSYTANSTVVVNTVIRNAGDKDVGTFVVKFTPQGMSAQTQTVTGLAVGATKTLRWTFTAPVLTSTQSKTLTVVADSTGVIEESNENNNTGTGSVTIIGEKPDLTVTGLTAGTSKYKPNETVTITATIRNNGIVPCPASKIRLTGNGITAQTKDVPALAAGGSTTVAFTFSAPYVIGDKTFGVTATADPDNQIAESNENNNSRDGSFTVSNPLPDLTVTKIQANKNEYTEDESGRVTVTVVNQGSKAVDSSKLRLVLGDFFAQTKNTGMIAVGSAAQVTFDFVAPETLERMTVTATATTDPTNEITESNENNNILTSTLAVKPIPPDLAIIATNAQNWYAGKEVVVTATVVNYTKRAVPEVTVRLTLGDKRYEEVIPMPGNGSNLAVFRVKLPTGTGTASLAFVVDPYNAIPEVNEGNNDLSKSVQIITVPVGAVLDPDLQELEQTYKTRGLLPIPNTANSDYHIWQEVRYEGGSYVTKTYWARLQTVFSLVPDPRIAYAAEPKRMESGFGVQVALRAQLTTNYDHPEKLVGVQMAWVYSPEAGYGQYSKWSGVFDALEISAGSSGDKITQWRYAVNPWSESGSRLHYTPLWFPDGQYTVLSQAFYAWSPAGQMYWYDAGSVDILGDMYDRVTAIQGR